MPAIKYPEAEWIGDGISGGSFVGLPWRLVIHTTEGSSLPTYENGRTAPHLTFDPARLEWSQHTRLDTAARALRNKPGGVQTNRANTIQLEIICYSDQALAETRGHLGVNNISAEAYDQIYLFVQWLGIEFGIQNGFPGKQAFSYAEADAEGFRMDGHTWNRFNGICGHQHVPENKHWDPGAFDWAAIVEADDNIERFDPPLDLANIMFAVVRPAGGVYLVGVDGGIYNFGGAPFYGSPAGKPYWGDRIPHELEILDDGYIMHPRGSNEEYEYPE